jgi:flavin reductase (DIM6/NTAB) family NADH-FMN oxidoreductase RutF/rubredoxin
MNVKALYNISYGLYIITSEKNGSYNGQIANTVFQITSEPLQIAISINKKNLTHEYIETSGKFGVSVLSIETPMKFIGKFGFKSGKDIDKFENVKFSVSENGIPVVVEHTLSFMEAKVINKLDCGTHTIFIGKILNADVLYEGEPMTYAYYHKIKGGKEPKNAPTYRVKEELEKSEKELYKCTICGYVYDFEKGDKGSNIKPGTKFNELPDNWVCPVCGMGKEKFEKM